MRLYSLCVHIACRYILDLTKEQKTQFVTKSTELANNAGLKVYQGCAFIGNIVQHVSYIQHSNDSKAHNILIEHTTDC